MIIKKFQGKTKEEALECARKELGEGLVEMNVKTVKAKGFLGMFKGNKIEITVAKEEENEKDSSNAGQGGGRAGCGFGGTGGGRYFVCFSPKR